MHSLRVAIGAEDADTIIRHVDAYASHACISPAAEFGTNVKSPETEDR
jgi:hypothetical protein